MRHVMRRIFTRLNALVFLVVTVVLMPHTALAGTATLLVNHGVVPEHRDFTDGSRHAEYGVYDGQIFFTLRGALQRLSPETGEVTEIEIVSGLPFTGDMPPARFTSFDGSLFFHLVRDFPTGQRRLLFRLDSPDGPAVQVERHRMHTTPMYVYAGALYFLINRTHPFGPICDFSDQVHALYRVDNAGAAPLEVAWNHGNSICDRVSEFTAGSDGLVFRGERESTRSNLRDPVAYRIKSPVSATALPLQPDAEGVQLSNRIKRSGRSSIISYQDYLFYGGEHLALTAHPDYPLPGPNEAPGPVTIPVDPVEVELYRVGPEGTTVYFDLHPKAQPDIFDLWALFGDLDIGSSYPAFFVAAQDALYFQAMPDGQVPELYRLADPEGQPELISLNPNLASNAQPIGEFGGRLWLQADSGAGYDIHYMAEDGHSAVPMLLSELVGQSARGFTAYGDGMLFTALTDSGELATWRVELPAAVEPPLPPPPPGPGAMTVKLEVNGQLATTGGAALRVESRDLLELRCVVRNNSEHEFTNTRIWLRRVQVGANRLATAACNRAVINPARGSACLRKTRALEGIWRYMCVAASTHPSGVRLRDRAFAFVRAQ